MITVHHGDAGEVHGDFDCLITDPPYSDTVHRKAVSNGTAGAGVVKRDLTFGSMTPELREALAVLVCRARRWSVLFSDIESAHLWREAVADRAQYIRTIPWVRWSQPQLSGDRPPSGCELVTLFHPKARKHWSGPGSLTAFDDRGLRGRDKHPTEKPLDLILSLVSWFSDVGDVVLDPCCGSGTTGLACRLLGRDAVLFDLSERYADVARERISAPLTERDQERCERWLDYQMAWLETPEPDTAAGAARYARARDDVARVFAVLTEGEAR